MSKSRQRVAAAVGLSMLLVARGGARAPAQASAGAVTPAKALVAAAVDRARAEGKAVLIEFGASWCVWCRSFDAFVHAPETRAIVAANYVVVNLTVQERDDKKALENPGGDELMADWGGAKSGLPFYVFLNGAGRKVADSNAMPNGTNVGFPGNANELQVFMRLIDTTAPRLAAPDRGKLAGYLNRVVKP